MGLRGASGGCLRPDLSIIIAIGHMPGPEVHRSVPEPSAEAIELAFPGRAGSVTWKLGSSDGPARSQWRVSAPRFACEEPVADSGADTKTGA